MGWRLVSVVCFGLDAVRNKRRRGRPNHQTSWSLVGSSLSLSREKHTHTHTQYQREDSFDSLLILYRVCVVSCWCGQKNVDALSVSHGVSEPQRRARLDAAPAKRKMGARQTLYLGANNNTSTSYGEEYLLRQDRGCRGYSYNTPTSQAR